MSGGTVATLLADLIDPSELHSVTPAKVANAASPQYPCGLGPNSLDREALRIGANLERVASPTGADSQRLAAVRKSELGSEREPQCVPSQVSQHSHGYPATSATADAFRCASVAWTDADIARFLDRRARLMRWGWSEPTAENVAERLVNRHRTHDERVSCIECRNYRPACRAKPGSCENHRGAGLSTKAIGKDLAALLQRCPAFASDSLTRTINVYGAKRRTFLLPRELAHI